jgi:hypothetical protein
LMIAANSGRSARVRPLVDGRALAYNCAGPEHPRPHLGQATLEIGNGRRQSGRAQWQLPARCGRRARRGFRIPSASRAPQENHYVQKVRRRARHPSRTGGRYRATRCDRHPAQRREAFGSRRGPVRPGRTAT